MLSVDGVRPAPRPRRLPDPRGRPRARPGHHADGGRRHHARPAGRRPGRGGGRPVVPAPADAAPSPLRRHHGRQPREHAVRRTAPRPRVATRSPPTRACATGCGPPASTRSPWRTTTPATTASVALVQTVDRLRRRQAAAVRRRPQPGRGASAGAGERATGWTSASSASTPSARPPRPVRGRREPARSACRSAPGRSTGPSSTGCSATSGGSRRLRRRDGGDAALGRRSTPSGPLPIQDVRRAAAGPRRGRPRGRRPPALGAGRLAGRRQPGRAVARQLHLRHDDARDQRGAGARGDVLGRRAQGRRVRALPDRRRTTRRAWCRTTRRSGCSRTSGGSADSAQPVPDDPADPAQLRGVDDGGHVRAEW